MRLSSPTTCSCVAADGAAGPSLGGAETESSTSETADEFTALDLHGTRLDQLGAVLLGDVVVVTLESPTRDAGSIGERVQFLVRGVAHQVAPLLAPPPPPGLVDQDRHRPTIAHPSSTAPTVAAVCWHTGSVSDVTLELEVAWQRYVGADQRLLDGVLARHREKHRRYHDATHVAWVIRHAVELANAEQVEHLDEVVAAAFYHDAVYEAQYPANERASARLARRDLGERAGWSDAAVGRVGTMIEATATHQTDPGLATDAPDLGVLLDADLAILAADPAGYSTYVAGVRSEYRHLDDEQWRNGRTAVVQALLDRSAIFVTATGHDRWEAPARANLTAELAALTD